MFLLNQRKLSGRNIKEDIKSKIGAKSTCFCLSNRILNKNNLLSGRLETQQANTCKYGLKIPQNERNCPENRVVDGITEMPE
jgi:hypothetical protein